LENSKARLSYLEGIRGLAAFIVLIAHFKNIIAIDLETRTGEYFAGLVHSTFLGDCLNAFLVTLLDGKLAVYVFWFMSGYVISIRLFGVNGIQYLKLAAIKRYFRLAIPVLASVLLAYLLMKSGAMYNQQVADRSGPEFHSMRGVFNFDPDLLAAVKNALFDSFFNFQYKGSYNPILWTMSPELFGSFCCFFLFLVFRTWQGRYFVFPLLAIAALCFHQFWLATFITGYVLCDLSHNANSFSGFVTRAFERIFSNGWRMGFIMLILVLINGIFIKYYSGYAKVLVSAGLVILVMFSPGLRSFFSSRLLTWLGRLSFSLYLVHLPLIYSLSCFLLISLPFGFAVNAVLSGIVTIIVALLLSLAFTKWIDRPAIVLADALARNLLGGKAKVKV